MASLSDALVQELLGGRFIAALASHNPDGSIHVVAVWYWFDGTRIYIATAAPTRKANNLQSNPAVSLMIDSRDATTSRGVSIKGTAQILTGDSSRKWNEKVHGKYLSQAALADPKAGGVFAGMDDITIQITPTAVITWDMRQTDRQFFGGVFANNPTYLLPLER